MKLRRTLHILLLLLMVQPLAALKFRCWMFCTEQTGIQTDYVDARDQCRKYAQLRMETDTSSPELINDRNRKSKLVNLFSACMGDRGWTVPDGKSGQDPSPPVPIAANQQQMPPVAAAPAPVAVAPQPFNHPAVMNEAEVHNLNESQREKNYLARQSECAFARHAAEYSSVSATRAKACDLECSQRQKAEPGGKLPAACPQSN